jgi:hypothetical protein
MTSRITFMDPCPDSVWEQLPGGPTAWNDSFGESWQYLGSLPEEGRVRHEFRHRAHPLYRDARLYAHVLDGDAGPYLGRLIANGRQLELPGSLGGEGEDALADPDFGPRGSPTAPTQPGRTR